MKWLEKDALGSRLGRRFTGLFIVCALIPLIGLAWITVAIVSARLEEDARTATRRASKAVGMTLMERFHSLQTDLRFAARELRGMEPDKLWSSPEHERRFRSRFLGMARSVGDLVIRSQGGRSLSIPEIGSQVRRHLNAGGMSLLGHQGRGGIEVVMATLADPKDPTMGMFYAWPDPEYLWQGDDFSGEIYEIAVCDEDRRILYATADSSLVITALGAAVSARPTTGHFDWEGAEGASYTAGYWQLFMRPHYGCNWMIVASRPRVDVLAPIGEFNRSFAGVAVLTILLILILSLVQIRRTLRPITVLTNATQRVNGDDLDVRVEISSRDEFQELGNSFNEMLSRLQENVRQREVAQSDLAMALDAALAAARTESEILTNVSHELRTPITSIRAFAEILCTYDEDPESMAEFSQIILSETERISRLLENMLSLSSIHAGHLELSRTEVDLGENVAQMVTVARGSAQTEDIRIDLSVPEEPLLVAADEDRLAQVWTNLLSNAVKFSPAHSRVHVAVRREDDQAVVEIKDHGPGIPQEDHALIFERFRQSTNNLTDKPSGTGLGLTIARDIVALHDGQIEVESELHLGATFRVYLPAPREAVGAASPAEASPAEANTAEANSAEAGPTGSSPAETGTAEHGVAADGA